MARQNEQGNRASARAAALRVSAQRPPAGLQGLVGRGVAAAAVLGAACMQGLGRAGGQAGRRRSATGGSCRAPARPTRPARRCFRPQLARGGSPMPPACPLVPCSPPPPQAPRGPWQHDPNQGRATPGSSGERWGDNLQAWSLGWLCSRPRDQVCGRRVGLCGREGLPTGACKRLDVLMMMRSRPSSSVFRGGRPPLPSQLTSGGPTSGQGAPFHRRRSAAASPGVESMQGSGGEGRGGVAGKLQRSRASRPRGTCGQLDAQSLSLSRECLTLLEFTAGGHQSMASRSRRGTGRSSQHRPVLLLLPPLRRCLAPSSSRP